MRLLITVPAEISTMLAIFGLLVIVFLAIVIWRGFVGGHHHLVTFRNAFLLGAIVFVGLSTLGLGVSGQYYVRPIAEDVYWFFIFVCLFFAVFLSAYNWFTLHQVTKKVFAVRPAQYRSEYTVAIALFALASSLFNFVFGNAFYIPFASEAINSISQSSLAFASVFAVKGWLQSKSNVFLILLAASVISICMVLAVMSGGGRRSLLSVLLTVPVIFYWHIGLRSLAVQRQRMLFWMVAGLLPLGFGMAGYNRVRHFDRGVGKVQEERTFAKSVEALKRLPDEIPEVVNDLRDGKIISMTGQDATACSLLLLAMQRKGQDDLLNGNFAIPSPFHSTIFAVCNPIPRRLWSRKPLALGYLLPIAALRTSGVNLGPGIVGHAVHEGGILFIVFYALLFAAILKVCDNNLIAMPDDPVNLGLLVAMAPNVIALIRGDVGVILVTFVFCILTYHTLRMVGRLFELPARKESTTVNDLTQVGLR